MVKESFIFIIFEVEYDLTRLVADRYWECTVSRQSNVAVGAGLFSVSNQGKMAIIVWALYGLKSRRSHLCNAIIDVLVYKASKSDSDVFMEKGGSTR